MIERYEKTPNLERMYIKTPAVTMKESGERSEKYQRTQLESDECKYFEVVVTGLFRHN